MADQSDRNCVVPALHRVRRDALKIHQGPTGQIRFANIAAPYATSPKTGCGSAPSKPSTERPWLTSNRCFVKSRKRRASHRSKHRLLIFQACVRRRFITLSFGLGLPQSEHRPGGIPNETKPTHARHFGDVLHDLGAQRFRFLGRGANVLYSNIGKPSSRSTCFMIPPPVPSPTLIMV